jgi:hypothetical protein
MHITITEKAMQWLTAFAAYNGYCYGYTGCAYNNHGGAPLTDEQIDSLADTYKNAQIREAFIMGVAEARADRAAGKPHEFEKEHRADTAEHRALPKKNHRTRRTKSRLR